MTGQLDHHSASVRWLVPSKHERELLEPFVPFGPDTEGREEIKRSRSRLVIRQQLADGRSVYLKRYWVKTRGRKAASLFHASKVKREYAVSRAAFDLGLPVARVVGGAEIRRGGFLVESYIAHEAVEPSVPLQALVQNPDADLGPLSRRDLLAALARFLLSIQIKGLEHNDLQSDHVLVRCPLSNPPEFALIDLDGARLHSTPLGLAAIVNNLVQLNRSLWGKVPLPQERLQFLRELIKVHPRLKEQGVARLWRRVAVLSALRREKRSYPKRLFYRSQFELRGQIPGQLQRILKKE